LALRRVPAERHDVAVAAGVQLVGDPIQLLARVADAGEMRHDGETNFLAQQAADLGGAFPRGAAGAVGDRHKIRRDVLQGSGSLPQGFDAGLILGREELQRAERTLLSKKLGDRLVGVHA